MGRVTDSMIRSTIRVLAVPIFVVMMVKVGITAISWCI